MLIRNASLLRVATVPALLGCCLSFSHSTAKAEIVVNGANVSVAQSIQEWSDKHIPVPFRAQDRVSVQLLDDRQMTAYLDGGNNGNGSGDRESHADDPAANNDDIDGVFEDNPPRVTLRVSPNTAPDMFTYAHEYGHYVWFDIFSKADRKRYEALYKRQRADRHLVTEYAATDVEEGFAEAFSFYIAEPALLAHRDSASSHFLQAWTAAHSDNAG